MLLTIISAILGILSAGIASIIRLFEKRMEYSYETRLFELKIEAATRGLEFAREVQDIKSIVDEGADLRRHDLLLSGGEFLDKLRASIRPVITYVMFFLFIITKIILFGIMLNSGHPVQEVVKIIFDDHSTALFATIMGFWFGSRAITKMEEIYGSTINTKSTTGTFKQAGR